MATAEDGGSLRNAIGTVVCPGDIVGRIDDAKAVLGEGLVQDTTFVRATRAGLVSLKPPRHFWIDGVQKRVRVVVPLRASALDSLANLRSPSGVRAVRSRRRGYGHWRSHTTLGRTVSC